VSYILDALKKSEQERSRGTIPDIKAIHRPAAVAPRKSSQWPYVLLVVLLLNAAGLGFWIYQQQNSPSLMVDQGEGNQHSELKDPAAGVLASPQASFDSPGNETQPMGSFQEKQKEQNAQLLEQRLAALQNDAGNSPTPKSKADSETEKSKSSSQPSSQDSRKLTSADKKPNVIFSDEPLSVSNTELKNAETADDLTVMSDVQLVPEADTSTVEIVTEKIYEIAELPDTIKRELPGISFAGHVYSSTQSQRSVMLNGKKMREGQEVTKGLLLEEITIDGVILRSQGYRFKLGALQDWSFP
jgi:general secretion pathway protein B